MQTQQTLPKPYYLRPNEEQREINDFMKIILPELESELAVTPLALARWHRPDEFLDNGTPCFIATKEPGTEIKQDYIWVGKSKDNLGAGYYHLRTREAYIEINRRLKDAGPGNVFVKNKNSMARTKKEKELYKKLRSLMKKRLHSDIPNDVHAARMNLLNNQSEANQAKAWGHATYLPVVSAVLLGMH